MIASTPTTGQAPLPIPLQDHSNDPADSQRLWALTAHQRVEAMWAGLLTLSQLNEWTRKRPHEVPNLGNEFAWIVMRTDEWDDMTVEQRNNIIHFPTRTQQEADRVAA